MKKGPIILVVLGLGLLALLYFAPVTPSSGGVQEEETSVEGETEQAELTPDQRVDDAIQKLESGEVPPMQSILKIRAVAEEFPDNVKANFTLGLMSIQTGQFEKAVNRFKSVLRVQPNNTDAMQFMASSQLRLGDTISAKENYSMALSLVKDSAQRATIQTELNNIN